MSEEEILLKEYDTLRNEILTAMTNRNSILTYGLATIGILYTGVAALDKSSDNSIFSIIILMVVSPVLCVFISLNWLGEYERMQRAGSFIVDLEKRINLIKSKVILSWETNLRSQKKHMKYPYHSTTLFLTVLSILSYFIGLYLYKGTKDENLFFSCLGLVVFLLFHIYLTFKIKRL